MVALVFRQGTFLQQTTVAKNAVERGMHFVTDVGQEHGFALISLYRLLARVVQFGIGQFQSLHILLDFVASKFHLLAHVPVTNLDSGK